MPNGTDHRKRKRIATSPVRATVLGRASRVYVERAGMDIWVGGETITCIEGKIDEPLAQLGKGIVPGPRLTSILIEVSPASRRRHTRNSRTQVRIKSGSRRNKFDNGCQSVRHTLHASLNHAGCSDWSCDTGRIASAGTIRNAATMVEAGSSCGLPRHRSDGCHCEEPICHVQNGGQEPTTLIAAHRLRVDCTRAKRATSRFAIGNADRESRNRWGGLPTLVEEE
jgi:hypothetical protein